MPDNKYILFCCDLFMYHGGVSDYTDNLAVQLFNRGRLDYVITPYGRLADTAYDIRKIDINFNRKASYWDRWNIFSKIATLFFYFRIFRESYAGLKKIKNDGSTVLFTEYYTLQFDIIIFCARLLKIKYGILYHGLDILLAKNNKFRFFIPNSKGADFLVFNSKATQQLFEDTSGIKKDNSVIIYPGINIADVERKFINKISRPEFRKSPDEIIVSTVCRLAKRKGVDRAIEIVHNLHATYPNIRYYIAGTGNEEEALKAQVKELGAEEYIIFLGSIYDKTKYKLLQESDLFILPNYSVNNSDFEGFGISFIEASLCDTVVIGGNHGGAKEAVVDGTTGFLFNFDKESSVRVCTEKLKQLLADNKQLQEIKNVGAGYVKANYDWKMLADKFLSFMKNV